MSEDKLKDAIEAHEASRELGYEMGLDKAVEMLDDEIRETERDEEYVNRHPGDPEMRARWESKIGTLRLIRARLATERRECSPPQRPFPSA